MTFELILVDLDPMIHAIFRILQALLDFRAQWYAEKLATSRHPATVWEFSVWMGQFMVGSLHIYIYTYMYMYIYIYYIISLSLYQSIYLI